MAGALMTMPMLIVNMGAEMIFVLDQRLKAQSIPRDKSAKVLEDILKTMHNEKFMTELFKPHNMYTNAATRQIFDRLAHSSIMRLNTNSMDKLYDLMRMGFKHQVLLCSSADELMVVTMNHLENTKALIDASDVKRLLDETILLTSQNFGSMSAAEFYLLKQYLCRFFQDTRIKVSLFLQNGIQSPDGTLALRYDGVTATGGYAPGSIRYHDEDGAVHEQVKFTIASAENAIDGPRASMTERERRTSQLGVNMYEADAANKATAKAPKDMVADAKRGGARGQSGCKIQKSFRASASDGLNLLADLLGTGGGSAKNAEDRAFRFNPFPDDMRAKLCEDDGDDDKQVPTIWIDASCDRKTTDTLRDDFDDECKGGHKEDVNEDDNGNDLLELMDSAA